MIGVRGGILSRGLIIACMFLITGRSSRCMSTPPPPPTAFGRRSTGGPHKFFSSQVQEWIDPNEHFSEDDIVRGL